MDVAYDHIQEEAFPDDEDQNKAGHNRRTSVNADFQDAYKAISSSPWAARLGGFFGTVRKQGEQYYEGARKEFDVVSGEASKGLSEVMKRTRGMSLGQATAQGAEAGASTEDKGKEKAGDGIKEENEEHPDRPENLSADIVKEASSMVSRFRSEAAKRLKDIEKAEDAADEALLKFGTNLRNFFRDAITIAPPMSPSTAAANLKTSGSTTLFESTDEATGKRVIHTTRFDAQLHVIHTHIESFQKDPVSPEWASWTKSFDVEKKTEVIKADLEKYEELRRTMEKLVPEKVTYTDFWRRYYFLRLAIETEEQKRKEMLKKASAVPEEEEVAWDEDSEDDDEDDSDEESEEESDSESPTPNIATSKETLKGPVPKTSTSTLKAAEPRRSNDQHSQADSDASYDLVSGASSRAPGSPKEVKKEAVAEESDEEDWE